MAEVGFFPGYPLSARAVGRATGLPAETATLAAAQLAGVGFWVYVLLFLRRGGVPAPLALATVLLLAAHPGAFFLAAGYSESLFLCATLGFFYWSAVRGPGGWLLAALHGTVMTATRIVGLPLAACPLLLTLAALPWDQWRWREVVRTGLLCGAASLGAGLFFAFCQGQYGRWDAYLYAQAAGWGVKPDYLALFKASAYRPEASLFGDDGTVSPNALSRWAVPLTVLPFGRWCWPSCAGGGGPRRKGARTGRAAAGGGVDVLRRRLGAGREWLREHGALHLLRSRRPGRGGGPPVRAAPRGQGEGLGGGAAPRRPGGRVGGLAGDVDPAVHTRPMGGVSFLAPEIISAGWGVG